MFLVWMQNTSRRPFSSGGREGRICSPHTVTHTSGPEVKSRLNEGAACLIANSAF